MYQRGRIQEESLHYEQKKHDGTLPIIGVNTFLDPHPPEGVVEVELTRSDDEEKRAQIAGVQAFQARNADRAPQALAEQEVKRLRGMACAEACERLSQQGFRPDLIVAHPGWGEALFLRDVFPQTPILLYLEFYYRALGLDVGFDPEPLCRGPVAGGLAEAARLRVKNYHTLASMEGMTWGLAPTRFQASTLPEPYRERTSVIFDGVDTELVRPDTCASFELPEAGRVLKKGQPVVTFVNRNLEPYRGYHIFMRALPAILKARPKARVLIVGGDGVSYGALPPISNGESGKNVKGWRQIFLDEVKADIDLNRVHFLGKIPYREFVQMLQLSTVHAYLTYPFVLSWSLLEAMSAGCAIVASNTPPVREAITHNETGRLVDFFDVAGLASNLIDLCENPSEREKLGHAARDFAVQKYDLRRHCLPGQLTWVHSFRDLPL
jgi:glycosyltransferase involved in cell wall biosynthesis